jgi:putative membrane protein
MGLAHTTLKGVCMSNSTLPHALRAAALALSFCLPCAAYAQSASTATALAAGDKTIVIGMARANMAEIEAGKLALSKSEDAAVKTFAQQMIDDHTKALNEVTTLAQAKGLSLPSDLDAEHKKMAAELGKLKGAAFDKRYMAKAGVADHKKVHAKLKKDEAAAKDPDVKALATKMLPTVEQHLNIATAHKH